MSNEFDEVQIYNKCFLVLPCMLAACEELASTTLKINRAPTFPSWGQLLESVGKALDPYQSNGKTRHLSDFLDVRANRISIKRSRNSYKTFERLGEIYRVLADIYFAAGKPIDLLINDKNESNELTDVQNFLKHIRSAVITMQKEERISELFAFVSPELNSRIIVEKTVAFFLDSKSMPKHPLFRSVDIFDSLVLPTEFFRQSGADSGSLYGKIYAVVREARGWAASDPSTVNTIVRDLLWLPQDAEKERRNSQRHSDQLQNANRGYYLSTVENSTFSTDKIEIHGDVMHLSASMSPAPTREQSMNLRFYAKLIDDVVHVRTAQISGVLDNNEKLGSWKCLLIRPDWPFLQRLEAIFARAQTKDVRKLMLLCRDLDAIGVIFNNSMRDREKSTHQRRVAFRNLSATNTRDNQKTVLGAFAQKELATHLARELSKVASQGNKDTEGVADAINQHARIEQIVSKAVDAVNETVVANWHLIEPSQIVTELQLFDLGDGADVDKHEFVQELLSTKNVESFR
jgi:hypothetical protein